MPYSKEIFSEVKQKNRDGVKSTNVVCVKAELACDNKDKPLMHPGYSRFVATIINNVADKKSYNYANIPAEDVYAIFDSYQHNVVFSQSTTAPTNQESSITSNVALQKALSDSPKMGKYKGRTYADLYSENPNILSEYKSFLEENLAKFPKNKEIIDSLSLILSANPNEIKNSKPSSVAPSVIDIYAPPMKPLMSKKDSEGRCLCYQIQISFCTDKNQNYPWKISITNLYAPVLRKENGSLNMQLAQAVNKSSLMSYLTKEQGAILINRLKQTLVYYESAAFPNQFKLACSIEQKAASENQIGA